MPEFSLLISTTLLPAWLVLPPAAVLMLLIAGHLIGLTKSKHPPSCLRIRQANGMMMLLAVPLLAAGTSLISHEQQPALWMLVWLAIMLLLSFSVMLALLDSLNTIRLARISRRRLRRSLQTWRNHLDQRTPSEVGAEAHTSTRADADDART